MNQLHKSIFTVFWPVPFKVNGKPPLLSFKQQRIHLLFFSSGRDEIESKRDHVAFFLLLCHLSVRTWGPSGGGGVKSVVFAGARRTVRTSLWAMEEGKITITCIGSTCPACTAVAAATAARPPSLLPPTLSATHLLQSTCKLSLLQTTVNLNRMQH